MKKAIVLAIIFPFLIVGCVPYSARFNSDGRVVRGAKVVVQKTNDQAIEGELVAVKIDALLLSEAEKWIDIKDIRSVKLSETVKGHPGYTLLGAVVGAGVGGLLAKAAFAGGGGPSSFDFYGDLAKALSMLSVGGFGGAFIGSQIEGSRDVGTVQIEEIHHPEELERALQALRSYARYPNYE